MKLQKRDWLIVAAGMAVALIILLFGAYRFVSDQTKNVSDRNISPAGKPYNVPTADGIIYEPAFYDEEYGHAEDNVLKQYNTFKPDYLKNVAFYNISFPPESKAAYYFPGFVLMDVVSYTSVPEKDMRRWFPREKAEKILEWETEGYDFEGIICEYSRPAPPEYLDIDVLAVGENEYSVVYMTNRGTYVKNYVVGDGKILGEKPGTW